MFILWSSCVDVHTKRRPHLDRGSLAFVMPSAIILGTGLPRSAQGNELKPSPDLHAVCPILPAKYLQNRSKNDNRANRSPSFSL